MAIIGGGTVGLSVATKLIESIEQAHFRKSVVSVTITIIAEHFYQNTTSFGSGGLWEPYQIAGTPDEKVNSWGKESFEHFRDIFYSDDAGIAGVQLITAYNLQQSGQRLEIPSWKEIVPNFRLLEREDLTKLGLPPKYIGGMRSSCSDMVELYQLLLDIFRCTRVHFRDICSGAKVLHEVLIREISIQGSVVRAGAYRECGQSSTQRKVRLRSELHRLGCHSSSR